MIYYVNNYDMGTYPYNSIGTAAKSFHELFATLGGELADGDVIKVIKLVTNGTESPMIAADPSQILIAYRNGLIIQGIDLSNTILSPGDCVTVEVDLFAPLFKFYKCSNVAINNIKFLKIGLS